MSPEQDPKKRHIHAFIIAFALILVAPVYTLIDILFIGHFKLPLDDVILLALTVFSVIMGAMVWLKQPVGVILCRIAFILWPIYAWWAHSEFPGGYSLYFAIGVTVVAIPLLIVSFLYNIEED